MNYLLEGKAIKTYEKIYKLLFPNRCPFCGRLIRINEKLCESCKDEIIAVKSPRCFKCGCFKGDCTCKNKSNAYSAIISPFYYEGAVSTGIKRWKFYKKQQAPQYFANALCKCVIEEYDNISFDFIAFVPVTQKTLENRGFNQSEQLALLASKKLSVPVINIIKKMYDTPQQHTLSAIKRSGNVLGVFSIVDIKAVRDKKILLVDDIKTTGATLNECAKTFLVAEAASVHCAVVAVARNKK